MLDFCAGFCNEDLKNNVDLIVHIFSQENETETEKFSLHFVVQGKMGRGLQNFHMTSRI
jgi:hypothetical protein